MQYRSAKLFEWHWNNRDACRDLMAVLPRDAYILARDHPMSEQKGDMFANPEGTGERHANEWAIKVATGNVHTPHDRTFFLGINEPDATSGDRDAIDRYSASFLDRLRVHGLRGGAFNFSTGHPRTVDGTGNTPADYTVFERTHQAIVRGHHIAVLHIYGTAAVPCAPGHYDRLRACPWQDVTWIVGECGADEHVIGGGNHDGYLRTLGASDAYCRWLDDFILGVNDPRIHSFQPFTYDFSHPWDSFDIRPIRPHLEGYRWQHATQTPAPPPAPVTATMFVTAPPGLRVRTFPPDGNTVTIIPFAGEVRIVGVGSGQEGTEGWLRVQHGEHEGWVDGAYVSTDKPQHVVHLPQIGTPPDEPPTQPTAAGIIEPRVAQAILRIESGGRTHGPNGKPIIRFEAHIFVGKAGNTGHFRYNQQTPWTEQQWRRDGGEWRNIHTGQQPDEYAALEFAATINREAAYQSISVGAGQIMGFNHARIGYPSATAMFAAFQDATMQTIGFINFFLSDPGLVDAMRRKDWREIARRYNGAGAVDTYAPLLEKAYQELSP